jgi:hypothetical protein
MGALLELLTVEQFWQTPENEACREELHYGEVVVPSHPKPREWMARHRLGPRQAVALCLSNGALECWLVDQKQHSVTVMRKDGSTALYEGDSAIPLADLFAA